MTIEISEQLESAIKMKANACGVSPDMYVREILQRDLGTASDTKLPVVPFKSSLGILAKYGPAPSAEEIDANAADMFRNFGEDF